MKTIHLLVILLVFSINTSAQETNPPVPPKWEYKIWVQPHNTSAVSSKSRIEKELNQLGTQGWELVSVVWQKYSDRTAPTGRMMYYYKRPVRTKEEQTKPEKLETNTDKSIDLNK